MSLKSTYLTNFPGDSYESGLWITLGGMTTDASETFGRPDSLTHRAGWGSSRLQHTGLFREISSFLGSPFLDLVSSPDLSSGMPILLATV